MKIETLYFDDTNWSFEDETIDNKSSVSLVLVFGDTDTFADSVHYNYLRKLYANADIVGASSAGNILGPQVSEKSIVATAITFEKGSVKVSYVNNVNEENFDVLSKKLVDALPSEELNSIFIISDGLHINGTSLAKNVNSAKPNTLISGGLAGDAARFEKTVVMANDVPQENALVAIGFYGASLHVSSGCYAGWSEFGAERIITRSEANVVYEIDNTPALELYKRYLGDEAKNLPSSGLRFPLSIRKDAQDEAIIRTLLAVDEENQSLTFAGDVPEASLVKLMKSNIDGLVDGSEVAAKEIEQHNTNTALGLVVSCVGRKLVMKDITDEELEVIEDTIGSKVHLTGFYSYGELAPFSDTLLSCKLHNQTMTLTVIYED